MLSSIKPDIFGVISQLRHLKADLFLLGLQQLQQGGEVVGPWNVNIWNLLTYRVDQTYRYFCNNLIKLSYIVLLVAVSNHYLCCRLSLSRRIWEYWEERWRRGQGRGRDWLSCWQSWSGWCPCRCRGGRQHSTWRTNTISISRLSRINWIDYFYLSFIIDYFLVFVVCTLYWFILTFSPLKCNGDGDEDRTTECQNSSNKIIFIIFRRLIKSKELSWVARPESDVVDGIEKLGEQESVEFPRFWERPGEDVEIVALIVISDWC